MKSTLRAIILVLVAALWGCNSSDHVGAWEQSVVGTGTVNFVGVESGFYGIVTDDDQKLDPINLPEEYRQEGLRVNFSAVVRPDSVSFYMWGTIVELKWIEAE